MHRTNRQQLVNSGTFSHTKTNSMPNENPESLEEAESVYEFSAETLKGETILLKKYKELVCIITNFTSKCRYMKKNYAELLKVNERVYKFLRSHSFTNNGILNVYWYFLLVSSI